MFLATNCHADRDEIRFFDAKFWQSNVAISKKRFVFGRFVTNLGKT
jgi:hypothetical protein